MVESSGLATDGGEIGVGRLERLELGETIVVFADESGLLRSRADGGHGYETELK